MNYDPVKAHQEWINRTGLSMAECTAGFICGPSIYFRYHLFAVDGLVGDCDIAIREHLEVDPLSDSTQADLGDFHNRHKDADYICWVTVYDYGQWSLIEERCNGRTRLSDFEHGYTWLRAVLMLYLSCYLATGEMPSPVLTEAG